MIDGRILNDHFETIIFYEMEGNMFQFMNVILLNLLNVPEGLKICLDNETLKLFHVHRPINVDALE